MSRWQKFIKREWANLWFSKPVNINLEAPIVSFSFDDAPSSSFENGGKILSGYGFPATYYISMSLLDTPSEKGGFQTHNLKSAFNAGHELACHTFGHVELSKVRSPELAEDIEQNQKAFFSIVPGIEFRNFSYPFGEQTIQGKRYLSTKFRSGRGIRQGINVGKTDLFNLKACKLYEARHSLDTVLRLIDKACDRKGWLIFYTHDVDLPYSKFGCSPSYFEAVVKETAGRGINVLTINEALNKIEKNYL